MTAKEKFLQIKSYEEFDRRRDEIGDLKIDKEVLEHIGRIFPRVSNTKEELYKVPRSEGGSIGNCMQKP